MLISALYDYYDNLSARGKLSDYHYEGSGISYIICLSPEGEMTGLLDYRDYETVTDAKGNTKTITHPKIIQIPERPSPTKISAYYVESRPGYIFGLEYHIDKGDREGKLTTEVNGKTDKQKEKLKLQHQSFCEEVKKDFGTLTSPIAQAYVHFAERWQPEQEMNNQYLLGIKADLNKCKFAFCLDGHPETLLQDEDQVRAKWMEMLDDESEAVKDQAICQCSVTGEELPVAEVHDALVSGREIGIKDTGNQPRLINFKPESFLSYGHKQGENACISVKAMKRYTTALNYLLTSPANHSYLDGQTVVFWSADGNSANDVLWKTIFEPPSDQLSADELNGVIKDLMNSALSGTVTTVKLEDAEKRISPDSDFYIACFAPNFVRIQVKYLTRKKFGKLLYNIAIFQQDMQISEDIRPVSFGRLKHEFTPPASTHPEEDDTAFDSIFRAAIDGTAFPVWSLRQIIVRMKKDPDQKVSFRSRQIRAGFIKACLIRNAKEEIGMAYDSSNTNPAYVCGALFAVLQKIQEDSVKSGSARMELAKPDSDKKDSDKAIRLNRTIKDAYFSMAASNPAAVMPRLIQLSTHHMKKLQREHPSWATNDSRMLSETMDKLGTEFPSTLNLYDQGRFILGYYQRYNEFFKKKQNTADYQDENQEQKQDMDQNKEDE